MACFCIIYSLHICIGHYSCITLLLCSMTHYDIKMGNDIARDTHCNTTMCNDIARDIHCDVTMSNDVVMCTSQCIITLLWTSFYVLLHLFIFLFHHKTLYNCTHKSLKSIIVWHKNKNKFMVITMWRSCSLVLVGIFHSSWGFMKYLYTKTIHMIST